MLDTAALVAGWANATPDNNHFDGGVLRRFSAYRSVREQVVTPNLLNVLLNRLARLHGGEDEQPATKTADSRSRPVVQAA